MEIQTQKEERRFSGIPVAQGIAHFPAFLRHEVDEEILPHPVDDADVEREIIRFEAALIANNIPAGYFRETFGFKNCS